MAPPQVDDSIKAVDDETARSEKRRLLQVEIRSVTKDSLGIAWYCDVTGSTDNTQRLQSSMTSSLAGDGGVDPVITGYKVRYQAVGSTYVQFSNLLKPTTAMFEITQLHENTYYNICVKLFTVNATSTRRNDRGNERDEDGVVGHRAVSHHRAGRVHGHRSGSAAEVVSSPSESQVEPGLYESVDIEWGDDYNVVISAERTSPRQMITESPSGRVVMPVREQQTRTFSTSAASRLNGDTLGLAGSAAHRLTDISGVGQLTMTSCVTASTGVNSLSVALGSTFGAFLALGVIVAFVLAAKWQHVRRTRKLHMQLLQRLSDSNDSLMLATAGLDGEIMMTSIAGDMTLQRVCFANGDGCDSGVIVVGGDSGGTMEATSSMSAADSSHHHQRHNHRVTMNGDIEMRRFHRASVGGDGTGNGKNEEYDDAVDIYYDDDNPDGDDGGSMSSDFSADIILHAGTDCPASDAGTADAEGTIGSKLVLDSATCAGSFILANDDPTGRTYRTGRTYSLLVPLSAVGVQPLLSSAASGGRGSDTLIASGGNIGGLQLVTIAGGGGGKSSGSGTAASGSTSGVGQSIVRLKLRKHATVDYSSIADGDEDYYNRRGSTSTVEPVRLAASSIATPASAMIRGMRPPLERHNVVINVQSATPTSTMASDAATASGERRTSVTEEGTLPDDIGLSHGRRLDCKLEENSRQGTGEYTLDQREERQLQEQPNLAVAETPSISSESAMKRSTSSGW